MDESIARFPFIYLVRPFLFCLTAAAAAVVSAGSIHYIEGERRVEMGKRVEGEYNRVNAASEGNKQNAAPLTHQRTRYPPLRLSAVYALM